MVYDPDGVETSLQQYDDLFDKVETPDPGEFAEIPDGQYQVIVEGVEMKLTKQTQKPMLAMKLRVIAPNYQGRVLYRNSVITPNTIGFLKRDLMLMGLELERFSHLWSRVHELINLTLEVTKKQSGDYSNIYLDKVLTIDPTIAQFAGPTTHGQTETVQQTPTPAENPSITQAHPDTSQGVRGGEKQPQSPAAAPSLPPNVPPNDDIPF